MFAACKINSPNEMPRAMIVLDPDFESGLVCEFWPEPLGIWLALHIIKADGQVKPVPPCFKFSTHAIKLLNDTLTLPEGGASLGSGEEI